MPTKIVSAEFRNRAVHRLRDMHVRSQAGHLGGNLSCLDILLQLEEHMDCSTDSFVLSKGHSAGALYVALWARGEIAEDELDSFHKDGTALAGHPSSSRMSAYTPLTGSLGHGYPIAVGIALGHNLAGHPERYTYCLTSDSEWQEGSMMEAMRIACSLKLANLVALVDCNGWQGFDKTEDVYGPTNLVETMRGLGANVLMGDGHSLPEIRDRLDEAKTLGSPTVIMFRTTKGRGWVGLEDTLEAHYLPPTPDLSGEER